MATQSALEQPLRGALIAAFDLETTGLSPARDRVVAAGVVRARLGEEGPQELAVFERLADPGRPIPPSATAIHGITDADVRGAPSLADVLTELRAFVGDAVPLSHVAAFDLGFLARPLRAAGLPPIEGVLDTALLGRALLPGLPNGALEPLAARLGVALAGRHSAVGDARICLAVLARLLPALEARGVATVGQALRFQGGDAAHADRSAYRGRLWL